MSLTSISALNDDCLYLIFKKFTVQELMVLEEVCIQFQRVANMVYRTYQVFDFREINNEFGIMGLIVREIAPRVGPYVHTVRARAVLLPFYSHVEYLLMHCKNLLKIDLTYFKMAKFSIPILSEVFENIKEIRLARCTFSEDIGKCLKNSTQLEVIEFIHTNTTGECLVGLKGIKKLNLCYSRNIQPQFFMDFCTANVQLQSVNIGGCPRIDTACFNVIATKLINLENLGIDYNHNATYEAYTSLANLPSLKSLSIYNWLNRETPQARMIKGLLQELSVKACDRLEELYMKRRSDLATNVLKPLVRFTKLRVLHLIRVEHLVDSIISSLACKNTLEELNISCCPKLTANGMLHFLKSCKSLKKLVVPDNFPAEFFISLKTLAPHIKIKVSNLGI